MEIWLGRPQPDTKPGTGTQFDPYNEINFDSIMAAQPPLGRIHLNGRKFRRNIANPWQVRPGQVISGVPGLTCVQFFGNAAGISQATIFGHEYWSNLVDRVILRDIWLDCNWAELSVTADMGSNGERKLKTGAVGLAGSGILLERLRVTNSHGSAANDLEQFAICLIAPTGKLMIGNIVRDCRAELPQGNYGAPFAMFGQSKWLLSHCWAKGKNDGLPCQWNTGGVNLANDHDGEISDSTWIDCAGAGYHDTAPLNGLRVLRNTVIRGVIGFDNNSDNADSNIEIRGNLFEIQKRNIGGANYGIGNTGKTPCNGWIIAENEIRKSGEAGKGDRDVRGISLNNNLRCVNTKIGPNIVQGTDDNDAVGAELFGNRDDSGKVVAGLEDTAKPTPVSS